MFTCLPLLNKVTIWLSSPY